jgi:hypothetical protein
VVAAEAVPLAWPRPPAQDAAAVEVEVEVEAASVVVAAVAAAVVAEEAGGAPTYG